ncbi:unnamed protein product [Closterium sp. NIES-53]
MMAALYFSFTSVVAFESSINPLHPPVPLLSTSLQWTAALNAVTAALYFSFTSVIAFESSINPLHPPFPLPSTSLQWTAALNAVTAALYFSFTSVVALVTFATFTCLGGQLTAASVFYVLTLLERAPLTAADVFYMLAHVPPGTSFLASVPLSRALKLRANSVLKAPHKHPHVPRSGGQFTAAAVFYMLAHAPRGASFLGP